MLRSSLRTSASSEMAPASWLWGTGEGEAEGEGEGIGDLGGNVGIEGDAIIIP